MALTASSRKLRERTSIQQRTKNTKDASSTESQSSTDASDDNHAAINVAAVRMRRTAYFDKTALDRGRQAKPMAQERRHRTDPERVRRVTAGAASSTPVHVVGSRSSVAHHRRRKRKLRNDEGRGGDYVYRTATPSTTRWAPMADRPTNSHGLRSLPQRSLSQQLGRTTNGEAIKRRQSFHGDAWARNLSKRTGHEVGGDERLLPKRTVSMRETSRSSAPKESLSRSQTTKTRRTRPGLPILPAVPEESKLIPLTRPRPTSVFGSIFGPARPPEPKVTCLTCLDDVLLSRTAKLECGHRMCRTCLKRIFTMSVKDPAHMPPKCCTSDCIPLKHVDKLFDTKFKVRWNRKYQEYTTKNRIYCPSRGCGAWIPPKDIRPDARMPNRRYGKCARCRTKVCATCNNKWHASRTCSNDEATQRFVDMAKEQGWQRCYNCKATVELKEGCNHMTCRCTAQFCMICGAKWKSCDCPWFNYAAVEADRLEHMNVAQVRRIALDPAAAGRLFRPHGYREEMEHRREQEQRDEELARHVQGLDLDRHLGRATTRAPRPLPDNGEDSFARPLDDFVRRATDLLTSPMSPNRAAEADRLVADMRRHSVVLSPDHTSGSSTPRRAEAQAPVTTRAAMGHRTVVVSGGREPRRPTGEGYASHASRLRGSNAHESDESESEVEVVQRTVRNIPVRRAVRAEKDTLSKAERGRPLHEPEAKSKDKGKHREMNPPVGLDADSATPAMLAGLTRKSTQGRVDAWRRHVGPGLDEV